MVCPMESATLDVMGKGRGSIRLKRPPDYWEVRAYAGTDPVTGKDLYESGTLRGGRREA